MELGRAPKWGSQWVLAPSSLCDPGPVAFPLWAWVCLSIITIIVTTTIIIIAEF